MKRLAIALLLLSSTISLARVQLVGKVKLGNGSLFTGKVVVTLPVATQDVSKSELVCPCQFEFPIQQGTFPANASVVATDIMSPSNVYYIMQFFDPYGNLKMTLNAANIIDAAGTYDIGQATPTAITTAQISYITPANLSANQVWTGNNTFSQPIISTVATGTPPFTVSSTTAVANLGATHVVSDNTPTAATNYVIGGAGAVGRFGHDDRLCWRNFNNTADDCIIVNQVPSTTIDQIGQVFGGTFTPFGLGMHAWLRPATFGNPIVSNSNTEGFPFSALNVGTNWTAANLINAGDTFFMHANGILTNTSGGNITYTLRARVDAGGGGAILCQSAGVVVATGTVAAPWKLDCTFQINSTGAGGTLDAYGIYTINATSGDIANAALVAIDTTVNHTPIISMQMSVANANGSYTGRTFYGYRLRY